jgi:hypothetical protein
MRLLDTPGGRGGLAGTWLCVDLKGMWCISVNIPGIVRSATNGRVAVKSESSSVIASDAE